ncbi:MAG: NUDIX hydrolase [Rickettsiales bacterium]
MPTVVIAAAAIVRENALLVVRKRGAKFFTQAGGKIEPNETPLEALMRELREELSIDLKSEQATFMGVFRAAAANEPDHTVEAHNFLVNWHGEILIAAEIETMEWLPLDLEPRIPIAPLLQETILPFLRKHHQI